MPEAFDLNKTRSHRAKTDLLHAKDCEQRKRKMIIFVLCDVVGCFRLFSVTRGTCICLCIRVEVRNGIMVFLSFLLSRGTKGVQIETNKQTLSCVSFGELGAMRTRKAMSFMLASHCAAL